MNAQHSEAEHAACDAEIERLTHSVRELRVAVVRCRAWIEVRAAREPGGFAHTTLLPAIAEALNTHTAEGSAT